MGNWLHQQVFNGTCLWVMGDGLQPRCYSCVAPTVKMRKFHSVSNREWQSVPFALVPRWLISRAITGRKCEIQCNFLLLYSKFITACEIIFMHVGLHLLVVIIQLSNLGGNLTDLPSLQAIMCVENLPVWNETNKKRTAILLHISLCTFN